MKKLTISLMMTALAVGCGDDDRDGIVIPDSGPGDDMGPVGSDMGPVGSDMGPVDRGTCDDAVPMLPPDFFPRCSAETFTCVMGATDGTMLQACLDGDTTEDYMGMAGADCNGCYINQLIYCGDSMGCHDQWADFNCCVEASGCTDQACVDANCGTETGAFQTCLQGVGAGCNDLITQCFAM